MSKIGLIVSREFAERARKKSFIITTILTPVLMIALMAAPALMMTLGKSEVKKIVVVDNTPDQIVGSKLQPNSSVEFQLLDQDMTAGQARTRFGDSDEVFGILVLGSDFIDNPENVQLVMNDATSMTIEESLQSQLQDIIRAERLSRYDSENISSILADANVRVSLQTVKNNGIEDDDVEMEQTSSSASYILGLVLGMMLYFILIVYGQQVLQSVIDEKQTRVLDVMVTSCSPFELMMGKILGIAAVAAVQILIWAVLVIGASSLLLPMLFPPEAIAGISDPMAVSAISKITDTGYIAGLFVELLLFIVGGFLFYASMYAAIGSAVDTPQDAAQFNTIIMMPIVVAIIVMMNIMNDPNSGLVFWCSMIPFTSPVVMMARIPFGIPLWQVVVSIVILFLSFVIMTWIAGRIFRVGVFMHGKKPTWKDLGAWIRMK